jgi:branched-chain amino acid transport system substrate-binding protein
VQRLKAANADVVMQSSYLGDALLAMKTYKDLGYTPTAILANDAGFNDSEFLKTLGKDGNFILSREVWALDLAAQKPIIGKANDLLQERYKNNFNGNSARAFTGILTLADAINRAGSTKPEAIQKALRETKIPGDQLIMPWDGIQFDETGQNKLGAGIIVQVQDGKYVTVWPFKLASKDIVWPFPPWSKR